MNVGMFVMGIGDDGWILYARCFFSSDKSMCSDGSLLLEHPSSHPSIISPYVIQRNISATSIFTVFQFLPMDHQHDHSCSTWKRRSVS